MGEDEAGTGELGSTGAVQSLPSVGAPISCEFFAPHFSVKEPEQSGRLGQSLGLGDESYPSLREGSDGLEQAVIPVRPSYFVASGERRALRILLIGHQFQVPSEGQAKAAALANFADLDVHVLCPSRYKEAETCWRYPLAPQGQRYCFNVTPVRNAWCGPAKWYLHWYPELRCTLERLRPDIVDLWEEPWSLLSAQVARLCTRVLPPGSRPAFVGETEQNIAKRLPPPFEYFRTYSLARMDFLVARNREAVEVARKKQFKGSARVVGNGVDSILFRPQDREACRRAAGLEGFVVGYAGRLVEAKGLKVLVEALRRLPDPKCLWLCGDGPLREELLKISFVKWAGALRREQLPGFYGALDALVLPSKTTPSWKEQFGRVLVEAQACGIPVVGSDSGAIPEVIRDAGLVFPEGDDVALAHALGRLRNEPHLLEVLAKRGRARATDCYSWGAIASQMREIYLQVEAARAAELRKTWAGAPTRSWVLPEDRGVGM